MSQRPNPTRLLPRFEVSLFGLLSFLAWAQPVRAEDSPPDPYALLDQLGQALRTVEQDYHEPPDEAKLLEGALRGMVSELDPHSAYLSRADLEIFEGSTSGRFGGIGVEVEFTDGEITVIAPVEDSPADRAGIRPGDLIVALDGKPLQSEKPHDVVSKMRGEVGSKLRLTIRNPETRALRDVEVQREEISVASIRSVLMEGGVYYFRIKAFQDGTHTELLSAWGSLRKQDPEPAGVILDLRNNPGGLVREARAVADEFLSRGTIFSTRHRGRIVQEAKARRGGAWVKGPLVILVNEYSASAAELVAGALRDNRRAYLVGAKTFGKGSVQSVLPLSHGAALKLTTALYYTPSGQTVQAKGVTPHITVDPGYPEGPAVPVVREEDLEGHLHDKSQLSDQQGTDPLDASDDRRPPPTNKKLHLGVARQVPTDPMKSEDLALSVAYRVVLGLPLDSPQLAEPAGSTDGQQDSSTDNSASAQP